MHPNAPNVSGSKRQVPPYIKQANRRYKSSKRGSPYLRNTLFVLMSILLKLSPPEVPVYQFLDRKRAEGKPFHVYMTTGANKFLRIEYNKVCDHLAHLY